MDSGTDPVTIRQKLRNALPHAPAKQLVRTKQTFSALHLGEDAKVLALQPLIASKVTYYQTMWEVNHYAL